MLLSCQVAELQGITGPTLDTASQEVPATLSSTDAASSTTLDKVQQWLEQQADALAIDAHLPRLRSTTASQLGFLPGFMTKTVAGAAAGREVDAAAASTLFAASDPRSADQEQSKTIKKADTGGAEASAQAMSVGDTGLAVRGSAANEQQAGDFGTADADAPKTWLEWEQQIQVMLCCSCQLFIMPLSRGCDVHLLSLVCRMHSNMPCQCKSWPLQIHLGILHVLQPLLSALKVTNIWAALLNSALSRLLHGLMPIMRFKLSLAYKTAHLVCAE